MDARFPPAVEERGRVTADVASGLFSDTFSRSPQPDQANEYRIQLNGKLLASIEIVDGGHAGTYCVAPVGVPQHYRFRVPRHRLKNGPNELVLCPSGEGQAYVMYDYIALQEPR